MFTNSKQFTNLCLTVLVILSFGAVTVMAQDSPAFTTEESSGGGDNEMAVLYVVGGVNSLRTGNYDQAMESFNLSIDANPEYATAYAARAMLYILQDNLDAALVDALMGYDINPDSPEVHFMLGTIAYEMAQYQDACGYFEIYLMLVEENGTEPALMSALFDGQGVILAQAQIDSSNNYLTAIDG